MICRRIFTIASLISLALCLASVALWVRGYWKQDDLSGGIRFSSFWAGDITHAAGKWRASVFENPGIPPGKFEYFAGPLTPAEYLFVPRRMGPDDVFFNALGMTFLAQQDESSDTSYYLIVPDCTPLLFFLFLPSLWLWRLLLRRNWSGLCVHCGYNLTGNTSGVCPECGAAVARKPEAAV